MGKEKWSDEDVPDTSQFYSFLAEPKQLICWQEKYLFYL